MNRHSGSIGTIISGGFLLVNKKLLFFDKYLLFNISMFRFCLVFRVSLLDEVVYNKNRKETRGRIVNGRYVCAAARDWRHQYSEH